MVRSVRGAIVRLFFLSAVLCLGVGCDILGGSVLVQPEFEAAGDLADRVRVLVDAAKTQGDTSRDTEQAPSLTAVVQVQAPTVEGKKLQASHVSYDPETRRLSVGYKQSGSRFGGGIDVLTFRSENPPPTRLTAERSFRSGNVDVMEVRSAPGGSALFVAGGVTTRKRGASPALVAKVTPGDSGPTVQSERLSDNVAKGLVVGPAPNTIHVATDEDALYQFNEALGGQTTLLAQKADGFRSLTAQGSKVFVLDRSGRIYAENARRFETLTELAVLTQRTFGGGGIARLEADEDHLYAALNQEGFSIFAPTGNAVWSGKVGAGGRVYTSVMAGPKYLYAGRFDGAVEVYRRPSKVPDRQPEHLRTFRLSGSTFGEAQTGAPINHLLATDGHLFVAQGQEGLIVLRVEEE